MHGNPATSSRWQIASLLINMLQYHLIPYVDRVIYERIKQVSYETDSV